MFQRSHLQTELSMFEPLHAYLNKDGSLTSEQLAFIDSFLSRRSYRKGEILVRAGDVALHAFFVVQGCLRKYSIDEKGKEHILEFAPENWWVSDQQSAATNTATHFFVDAIEPTEVILIDWESNQKILRELPQVAAQYRAGLERSQAAKQRRISSALQSSATDRYLDFLERYPTLALRIPQHMLASYLGITPETLSRIRAGVR